MRRGFTLVELSIVLVIIGLLIGGILAAQSMITTTKINASSMQIGQFDSMVENFKTKYNCLPGDCLVFGGNGDGLIAGHAGGGVDLIYGWETVSFWNEMDAAQFPAASAAGMNSNGNTNGTPAYIDGPNKNSPAAKLGKQPTFFMAAGLTADGANLDFANPRNYYALLNVSLITQLGGTNVISATTAANSSVKPIDLLALDKKIDDGLANSGNVISGSTANYTSSTFGNIVSTPVTGICSSSQNYLPNNAYECTPLIRIGTSVSDPQ